MTDADVRRNFKRGRISCSPRLHLKIDIIVVLTNTPKHVTRCTKKRTSLSKPVTSPTRDNTTNTRKRPTNYRDVTSRTNSTSGSSRPANLRLAAREREGIAEYS